MSFEFKPAERRKAKARLALMGVTGAGKTLGALYIAYGLTGDWGKVTVIDTEHDRALFYANRKDLNTGAFLHTTLDAPYSPERYKEAAATAAKLVGADGCVIIDNFSHAWNQEGGVLDIKEGITRNPAKRANDFSAWNEAGKIQNSLVNFILSVDCHTIVTLRSKMDYVVEEDDRGKKVPRRIGLAPIQRDNVEYEFDMILDVHRQGHRASVTKDTTGLLADDFSEVITPKIGENIRDWVSLGKDAPPRPRCDDCGAVITAAIANGTKKRAGRQLCKVCYGKWLSEQQPAAVSEGAAG